MSIDLTNLNLNLINEVKIHLTDPSTMTEYKNEFECAYNCFFQLPGENHYHLFANISNQINNAIIIDLGTYRGLSTLAWSYNESNIVHTFDIEYDYAGRHNTIYQDQQIIKKDNIKGNIYDIFKEDIDNNIKNLLLNSTIIFMDAGDHLSKKLETFLIDFLHMCTFKMPIIYDNSAFRQNYHIYKGNLSVAK